MLQMLDTAWKDHLLAMDHLRIERRLARLRPGRSQGRVQARGHADFRADVGLSVGERVTDLIFRMEAARRGFRRLDVDGKQGRPRRAGAERHDDRQRPTGGRRWIGNADEDGADPQPRAASGPQRSLPLRQRQEIQELLHAHDRTGVSETDRDRPESLSTEVTQWWMQKYNANCSTNLIECLSTNSAVLDFAQGLARGRPRGASGADMMKFFGRLPPDDAQRMAEVIEEGCERIFPNEWQLPP